MMTLPNTLSLFTIIDVSSYSQKTIFVKASVPCRFDVKRVDAKRLRLVAADGLLLHDRPHLRPARNTFFANRF